MLVDVSCTALEVTGAIHTLNLSTGALGTIQLPIGRGLDVMASTPDGSLVAMADAAGVVSLYNATTGTISQGGVPYDDVAVDADGNCIASRYVLYNQALSFTSFPLDVDYLQAGPNSFNDIVGEKLGPSGSLLYVPQLTPQDDLTQGVDVFDVHRQRLALRVALPDPLPGSQNGMALDETGTKMFLISSTGITVAELQAAPLSIATVAPPSGPPGTQVTIRGSGFTNSASVTIGTTAATPVFVDQNTLQVTIPSLTAGPVRVTVTNSGQAPYSFDAAFTVE